MIEVFCQIVATSHGSWRWSQTPFRSNAPSTLPLSRLGVLSVVLS